MLEIVENYGRAILLCVTIAAATLLIFTMRLDGNVGIMHIIGNQSQKVSVQENSEEISDVKYKAQLSKKQTVLKVNSKVYANTSYKTSDVFSSNESIEDIRVIQIQMANTGEDKDDCILAKGKSVCFSSPGMYCVTVWTLTDKNVETKSLYQISVM